MCGPRMRSSDLMEAHHYSGWTKDTVANKLKHIMLMAAITARAEMRNNTATVLKHPDNVVKGSYLATRLLVPWTLCQ